jgi:hypothetical protein
MLMVYQPRQYEAACLGARCAVSVRTGLNWLWAVPEIVEVAHCPAPDLI